MSTLDKGGHKHLPDESKAREADAIQRAHDLLTSVVLGEVPVKPPDELMPELMGALSALCWVLNHDHNPMLYNNLAAIEKELLRRGYVLTQAPELSRRVKTLEELTQELDAHGLWEWESAAGRLRLWAKGGAVYVDKPTLREAAEEVLERVNS